MRGSYTFHLIPNAHIDPVWLWDWREGLNEGLITARTVLSLMDEFPDLTFVRGESLIYEHIERQEPETFARILRYVRAGRWDPIGGGYLQPDTNLPATETMSRNFLLGQRYFAQKFGRPSRVAWAADSFGHSAGMPEILAGAGFRYFAFFRPFKEQLALPGPAFWWEGSAGSRVLAYRPIHGWYGCERGHAAQLLDGNLKAAAEQPYRHVAIFYGMGNHGGGPTRRLVHDIHAWAKAHPEVSVVHSGLHRFFAALEKEIASRPDAAPGVHRGEMGYVQRGCYVSAARFKFAFRRAEAGLARAEAASTAVRLVAPAPKPDLSAAWRSLVFNSFHDILPGSSIERAMEEQVDWTRGVQHTARAVEFDAMNAVARGADTSVPAVTGDYPTAVPILVWNPHAHPYKGPLELEVSLDWRPLWGYLDRVKDVPVEVRDSAKRIVPWQKVATESTFGLNMPWRWRVLVQAQLPALGWSVFTVGWVEGTKRPEAPAGAAARRPGEISNQFHRVQARSGGRGIALYAGARRLLGAAGLGAITVEDAFGSWGGCYDEPDSMHLLKVRHAWKIVAVQTIERGPLRSALWVKLAGGHSELELTFQLSGGRRAIDVEARLLWNEKRARLKLVFPGAGDRAEFDVSGGVASRGPLGEVPGGRWARVKNGRHVLGFASDALYGFDASGGTFRASVIRSSRYSFDARDTATTPEWLPVADRGEYRFKFLLTTDGKALPRLAAELEQAPNTLPVPAHRGALGRSGSVASLKPEGVRLLALKPAEKGDALVVRVQDTTGRKTSPRLKLAGRTYKLGSLAGNGIATYRLSRGRAEKILTHELLAS